MISVNLSSRSKRVQEIGWDSVNSPAKVSEVYYEVGVYRHFSLSAGPPHARYEVGNGYKDVQRQRPTSLRDGTMLHETGIGIGIGI